MFKRLFLSLLIVATLVSTLSIAPAAKAWFGAGSTPGWPVTTTGLRGEIALPVYKFSPDFYNIGNTVTITTTGFNDTDSEVTSHYYLVINRVIEAPKGTNVTDGQPTTPGLNENQLYDYHQANNDTQSQVAVIDLGNKTFPAKGQLTFSGSYTTTQTGYYQFDVMDEDPSNGFNAGHILSAGFFRVLNLQGEGGCGEDCGEGDPSPTPSPSPTATPEGQPSPTPTATPAPDNKSGARSSLGAYGPKCENNNIVVTMELKDNGNAVTKRQVKFVYRNSTQTRDTDDNGRAEVTYNYDGDDAVSASADGFPSQSIYISGVKNCPPNSSNDSSKRSGSVLGASTTASSTSTKKRGRVLGASTLAATGTSAETLFFSTAVGVMLIGAAGVATDLYLRKK